MVTRRTALAVPLASSLAPLQSRADQPSQVNLSYQKTGIPLLARQLQVYERRLEPLGQTGIGWSPNTWRWWD